MRRKCANPSCKTIVNHPHHRYCNSCYKNEKKAKQDNEDDDHLGATVANEVRGKQNDKRKKKRAKAAQKRREQDQANDPAENMLIEVVETESQGGNSHNESIFQTSTVSKPIKSKGLKLKSNKKLVLKSTSSSSSPGKLPVSAKRLAKVLKSQGIVVSISKKVKPHEKRQDKSTAKSDQVSLTDASYDFCSREGIMLSQITGAELKLVEVVSDEINESTNTNYFDLWVTPHRNVERSNDFSREEPSFQNSPLGLSTFQTHFINHALTVRPADIGYGNATYAAPQLMPQVLPLQSVYPQLVDSGAPINILNQSSCVV